MRQDIIERATRARHTKGQTTVEGHIYTGNGGILYARAEWAEDGVLIVPKAPKRVG